MSDTLYVMFDSANNQASSLRNAQTYLHDVRIRELESAPTSLRPAIQVHRDVSYIILRSSCPSESPVSCLALHRVFGIQVIGATIGNQGGGRALPLKTVMER
jgi:hypothetical protein